MNHIWHYYMWITFDFIPLNMVHILYGVISKWTNIIVTNKNKTTLQKTKLKPEKMIQF